MLFGHWWNVFTAAIGYLAVSFGHWRLMMKAAAQFHDPAITRHLQELHDVVLWLWLHMIGG